MPRVLAPLLKTVVFTILVPGFVTVGAPYLLLGGTPKPGHGPLAWLGLFCLVAGAGIYFRTAWEFAVRGLGTPAPIAPTKFLVVSGLHRYVRNPMYIGVLLVILGEAAMFRASVLGVVRSGLLGAGQPFCHVLRRTHAGEAIRRIVRAIPPHRAALDPTLQEVNPRMPRAR